MLRTIGGGKSCQRAGVRCWFPKGDYILLISRTWPEPRFRASARFAMCGFYAGRLAFGSLDQVEIASSHLTLVNAAIGWPHAHYRVRSGPNGADLALLDVLRYENVPTRFTHVAIGSGDGVFAEEVAGLAAAGSG